MRGTSKPQLEGESQVSEALVPVAEASVAAPVAMFTPEQMEQALIQYRGLQAALDRQMPDSIMQIGDKQFRKKAYWRAIAVAFNLEVTLVKEELVKGEHDWGYVVTYRAAARSGRSAEGDGACMASEKNTGRMKATLHNVRSHAHTRAYNRAVSNLVGFGEVSAEEVGAEDTVEGHVVEETPRHEPASRLPASHGNTITGHRKIEVLKEDKGTKRDGTPWVKHWVKFSDGESATTFDKKLQDVLFKAKRFNLAVEVKTEPDENPKYRRIADVKILEDSAPDMDTPDDEKPPF